MITLISTYFLSIIALCFAINLAKRNVVINNEKNMIYIYALVLTITLLILEISTILMGLSDNSIFVIPYRIANILGFSLSPVVTFIILLFFRGDNKKNFLHKFYFTIPLYFNAFICILSYKTGFIFFVDAQNRYTRGEFFLLPTMISMFYYVLSIFIIIKNSNEYEPEDKVVIITIFLLPVLGIIIQILFENIIIIWSCTSISLLLYYIFLLELQFRYDVQTKTKNRSAFEKEMQLYISGNNNATIIMFDINNLKVNNDKYGHKAGDEMIYQTAKIIKESFMGIGKAYRIGGDEFCVICKEVSNELVDRTLSNLDDLLNKINQTKPIKISLAHGHAFYNKDGIESIYSTLSKADKAMYINKIRIKDFTEEERTIRLH